jgi:quinohemoprotein ethanol dehydrogenase
VPKPAARGDEIFPKPPETKAAEAQIRHGEIKFIEQCSRCHVLGACVTPDLRKLPLEVHDLFKDILLKGALAPRGMERFDDLLSEADAGAIHAYLINQRCPPFRGRVNEGRQRGAASRWRTGRMVIRTR